MRHISFDESTVLNELMRIAHKDGLIKVAQEIKETPVAPPPQSIDAPSVPRAMDAGKQLELLQYFLKTYPSMGALYAGKGLKADQLVSDFKDLGFRDQYGTLKDQRIVTDPKVQKMVVDLRTRLGGALEDLRQLVNRLPPQRKEHWMKNLQLLQGLASEEHDMVKSAKGESDKYYDITGETGEQLVEKAHPGGGTRTELTHSKTDENLVETIVEQQKKDLEVARSVPKGTYAELMSLYGTLIKMGYKEHLSELKGIIKSVATTNEIIEYTLTVLADKLDLMGFDKSADLVDGLIKKKVAQSEAATQLKEDVLLQLQRLDVDGTVSLMKQQAIKEWQGRSMPTLVEAVNAANNLAERWGRALKKLPSITQSVARRYSPQLKYEQQSRELQRAKQAPGGNVQPALLPSAPKIPPLQKKRLPRGKKIKKFQEWYNATIKGTPYAGNTLDVDSVYGPKTKAADLLARRFDRGQGARKGFEAAMAKKRTTPPTTPAPASKTEPELELEPIGPRKFSWNEVYESLAAMYDQTLRHPKREPRFPSLGRSPDIVRYLRNAATEVVGDGIAYTSRGLKRLLLSIIGQMGRAGAEEAAAAGRLMET